MVERYSCDIARCFLMSRAEGDEVRAGGGEEEKEKQETPSFRFAGCVSILAAYDSG